MASLDKVSSSSHSWQKRVSSGSPMYGHGVWHFLLLFNPWISHHNSQRSVEYEASSKKGQVTFSEGSTVLEVPTFFNPSSSLQRSHREESYGVVAFSYGQTGASVHISDTATLLR